MVSCWRDSCGAVRTGPHLDRPNTDFTQTLPRLPRNDVAAAPGYPFAHSMTATYGRWAWWSWPFWLLASVSLAAALFRFMEHPDGMAPHGLMYSIALLVATTLYFATTSYDYNLILEIPLLIALIYSRDGDNPWVGLGTVSNT